MSSQPQDGGSARRPLQVRPPPRGLRLRGPAVVVQGKAHSFILNPTVSFVSLHLYPPAKLLQNPTCGISPKRNAAAERKTPPILGTVARGHNRHCPRPPPINGRGGFVHKECSDAPAPRLRGPGSETAPDSGEHSCVTQMCVGERRAKITKKKKPGSHQPDRNISQGALVFWC